MWNRAPATKKPAAQRPHPAHQVLVGQPRDLMLQAGLDAGLWGQLQVLGQQLLLPVILLFQALDLPSEGLGLILVAPLLRLQLGLQEPAGEHTDKKGKGPHIPA